ncbi:hypothetical protein BDV06DRAFT_188431 [Aspergillus oleicola]
MPPFRPLVPSLRPRIRFYPPTRQLSHKANLWHVNVKRSGPRGYANRCLVLAVAVLVLKAYLFSQESSTSYDVESRKDSSARHDNRGIESDENGQSVPGKPHKKRAKASFIPIGWPRLREGKFYAASDPEWKVFTQVSKDDKKLEALKDELASITLGEASQSSVLANLLGPPFKINRDWLHPQFPSRAPPVYCRSGLLFTDYGISWTSEQPMSNKGIGGFVPPHFVSLAVKNAYLVLWQNLLDKFNFGNLSNERSSGFPGSSSKTVLQSDLKTLDKLGDTTSSESRTLPSPEPNDNASSSHDDRRSHPSVILSTLGWLPLPKYGPGTDLYAASLAFKQQINECRARDLRTHRRGTFFVRGPVGLEGSLGFCRIEVEGEYDPMASEWVSISMHLRDLDVFNNRPLSDK